MYPTPQHRKNDSIRKRQIIQAVKNVPCMDCGVKYPPYVMDFDHRNPAEKSLNISKVSHHGLKALLNEITKCDIVCSNCHRERTNQQRIMAKRQTQLA